MYECNIEPLVIYTINTTEQKILPLNLYVQTVSIGCMPCRTAAVEENES